MQNILINACICIVLFNIAHFFSSLVNLLKPSSTLSRAWVTVSISLTCHSFQSVPSVYVLSVMSHSSIAFPCFSLTEAVTLCLKCLWCAFCLFFNIMSFEKLTVRKFHVENIISATPFPPTQHHTHTQAWTRKHKFAGLFDCSDGSGTKIFQTVIPILMSIPYLYKNRAKEYSSLQRFSSVFSNC